MGIVYNFNKIKKERLAEPTPLVDIDTKKADELAMDLVKHLARTTTSEDIDANRLLFILDEIVNQVNNKYI